MARVIALDSPTLKLLTGPPESDARDERCRIWLASALASDATVILPAIVDYETRRAAIFNDARAQLRKLDALRRQVRFVSMTDRALALAAKLWAESRRRGHPTTHPERIDVDVILAAQALDHCGLADELVIATDNISDLGQFADARRFEDIRP